MNFSDARTLLFTPGNRSDRFLKVLDTPADGIVIDLEDAVSLPDKDSARQTVIEFLKTKPFSNLSRPFLFAVRINSIQTAAGVKDIAAFSDAGVFPTAFVFPKVEYAEEVVLYDKHFCSSAAQNLTYMVLIETALGLQNADRIAASSPRISGMGFGGGDLAADLGAKLAFEPMLYARSRVVQAARTRGLCVFDVPFMDIHDDAGNREESTKVKQLGYTGKFAIHPAQLKTVVEVFSPTASELEDAEGVVSAYENAKGNAVQFKGKMIDVPIYKSALRIVNLGKRKGN